MATEPVNVVEKALMEFPWDNYGVNDFPTTDPDGEGPSDIIHDLAQVVAFTLFMTASGIAPKVETDEA